MICRENGMKRARVNVSLAVLVVRAGGGYDWMVTDAIEKNGEIQELLRLN